MDNNLLKDKKILIIEDEVDILSSLRILFEAEGAKIFQSEYASIAIEIAEKELPDLCIFDVMLPDESGIQLFVEFKNHPYLNNIPVVFVTGVNTYELGNSWSAEKISEIYQVPPPEGFIEKPFNPDELIRIVCDIFHSKK
ncbi:MAG: response regulator [Candidatus Hydrogenedens sp.]